MSLAITACAYFIGFVVLYYAALFVLSFKRPRSAGPQQEMTFAIFVPALNEDAVIEQTLNCLLSFKHDRTVICVADDASSDATPAILARFADDPRVVAIRREAPRAQTGKSDVLNNCVERVLELIGTEHPILGGADPSRVVAGIVDADGRLDFNTLDDVAPFFSDENVASVQIGVRIANAQTNLLTRMQDMEFVGFSAFVQKARDHLGSSGLGGNGQFTRLSALLDVRERRGGPWKTDALTEDLELGLALVCNGWKTRYCSTAYVSQQGLPGWRALFRQRTRWIQGHYSCWGYMRRLLSADTAWSTRLDLTLYLLLIVTVMAVSFSVVVSTLAMFGVLKAHSEFLAFIAVGRLHNAVSLAFGITPLAVFMYAYQRHALKPFRFWDVPAAAMLFTLYTYVWVFATGRSLLRLMLGRSNWVKTPRVADTDSGVAVGPA